MIITATADDFLDMLAAVARKDYEDRRRRGLKAAKAKAEGRYKRCVEDRARNDGIVAMLESGVSWSRIQDATGCGRATIHRVRQRMLGAEA